MNKFFTQRHKSIAAAIFTLIIFTMLSTGARTTSAANEACEKHNDGTADCTSCGDKTDNDSDGTLDCDDAGCLGAPNCYKLLAPLPGLQNINTSEGLAPYVKIMFRIAIGIAGVIAVVMIVYSGIEYMLSDVVFDKKAAKARIWSAIGGLILLIGSVVVLNTINPDLLNVSLNMDPVTGDATSMDSQPEAPTAGGLYCTRTVTGGYPAGANWATTASPSAIPPACTGTDSSRWTNCIPPGVVTNHPEGDCTSVGQGVPTKNGGPGGAGCTSLRGLDTSVLIKIKQKCPACQIVITAGTECWLHGGYGAKATAHKPGQPTMDLRVTPSLNEFVTGNPNFTFDGDYHTAVGAPELGKIFLAELSKQTDATTGEHWHVGH